MTRCPKCGKDSPDQAKFCRFCGGQLGAGVESAATPETTISPEQRSQKLLEEAFRLSEQGRILAAIQTCQQALALNPQSTSAHSLLGTLYERQGDREKAIREYEQVLTLSPESTVERRRLNELMGVATAREPVTVSPRVARFALTGAFAVLCLVAIAAFTLTRPDKQPRKEMALRSRAASASGGEAVTFQQDSPMLPTPGRALSPARTAWIAPPPAPRARAWASTAAPSVQTPANPGSSYLAPGAYLYPSTGADRYYAGRRTAAAPLAGAQQYRGAPVVGSGPWTSLPGGVSQQSAREYYLQGNYQQAAQSYQQYLAQNPSSGGATREELGWVYLQMGQRDQAAEQYRDAMRSYQMDLARGHNTEAARHGLRTCEAAIKALEAQ